MPCTVARPVAASSKDLGGAQLQRHPRKDPGEGAVADLLRQGKVDLQSVADVVTMDEQFGDGHPGPAAGIGQAAGVPGPRRAEAARSSAECSHCYRDPPAPGVRKVLL